jgi:hypothetical protein
LLGSSCFGCSGGERETQLTSSSAGDSAATEGLAGNWAPVGSLTGESSRYGWRPICWVHLELGLAGCPLESCPESRKCFLCGDGPSAADPVTSFRAIADPLDQMWS